MSWPPMLRDGKSANFFDGATNNRLIVAECVDCGQVLAPEALVCLACGGRRLRPTPASGHGTLVTWTVVHRAPNPVFTDCVPYTVGVVELTEGPWLYARIDVRSPEQGMALTASFEHPEEGESYPVFITRGTDG